MNRSTFMAIAAAVSLAGGLALLLAPTQLAEFYGAELADAGVRQAQLLGAAYLGYAAINWWARDVRDFAAQRTLALGNFVSWAVSLVVVAIAIVSIPTNPTVWTLIVSQAIFAAAWAYFSFVRPAEVPAAA